jgi:GNAT superfamily N-acetyltransferase
MQLPPTATTLPNGYSAVPTGHLATVVTSLEMLAAPSPMPREALPDGFELRPVDRSSLDTYRTLFRNVGADWLWFSRLTMPDEDLRVILDDHQVDIFVLQHDGRDAGVLELDFRQPDECELVYFGLTAGTIGKGIGRALMAEAIRRAWSRPIKRLWVHTCTLDHPGALGFYCRAGFTPYALQVEVAPDPRLTGVLPRTCAQHVPLLG